MSEEKKKIDLGKFYYEVEISKRQVLDDIPIEDLCVYMRERKDVDVLEVDEYLDDLNFDVIVDYMKRRRKYEFKDCLVWEGDNQVMKDAVVNIAMEFMRSFQKPTKEQFLQAMADLWEF